MSESNNSDFKSTPGRTPQAPENFIEFVALLETGYVLHEPDSSRTCDITLPLVNTSEYQAPSKMWYVLMACIKKGLKSVPVRMAYLQEPHCAPSWCLIHVTNVSAIRWELTSEQITATLLAKVAEVRDLDDEDVG